MLTTFMPRDVRNNIASPAFRTFCASLPLRIAFTAQCGSGAVSVSRTYRVAGKPAGTTATSVRRKDKVWWIMATA